MSRILVANGFKTPALVSSLEYRVSANRVMTRRVLMALNVANSNRSVGGERPVALLQLVSRFSFVAAVVNSSRWPAAV
jgi:hypothetical protein